MAPPEERFAPTQLETHEELSDPHYFVVDLHGNGSLRFDRLFEHASGIGEVSEVDTTIEVKFLVINDQLIIFHPDNEHRGMFSAMCYDIAINHSLHEVLGEPDDWQIQCGGELKLDKEEGAIRIYSYADSLGARDKMWSKIKDPELLSKPHAIRYIEQTMIPELQHLPNTTVQFDRNSF